jgi:hypothetical protein
MVRNLAKHKTWLISPVISTHRPSIYLPCWLCGQQWERGGISFSPTWFYSLFFKKFIQVRSELSPPTLLPCPLWDICLDEAQALPCVYTAWTWGRSCKHLLCHLRLCSWVSFQFGSELTIFHFLLQEVSIMYSCLCNASYSCVFQKHIYGRRCPTFNEGIPEVDPWRKCLHCCRFSLIAGNRYIETLSPFFFVCPHTMQELTTP